MPASLNIRREPGTSRLPANIYCPVTSSLFWASFQPVNPNWYLGMVVIQNWMYLVFSPHILPAGAYWSTVTEAPLKRMERKPILATSEDSSSNRCWGWIFDQKMSHTGWVVTIKSTCSLPNQAAPKAVCTAASERIGTEA